MLVRLRGARRRQKRRARGRCAFEHLSFWLSFWPPTCCDGWIGSGCVVAAPLRTFHFIAAKTPLRVPLAHGPAEEAPGGGSAPRRAAVEAPAPAPAPIVRRPLALGPAEEEPAASPPASDKPPSDPRELLA